MLEHRGPVWRHAPAALGTALLVGAAVVGTQAALFDAGNPRAPLSPYAEGGFTVGVAAVDKRITITSADDGSYVLGYTPAGGDVVLDLDLLSGDRAQPYWYDAATGRTLKMATLASAGVARFPVPKEGGGPAWVLVVDDVAAGYGAPDTEVVAQATGEDGGSSGASPAGPAGGSAGDPGSSGSAGSSGSGAGGAGADGGDTAAPGDGPASGSAPEQGRFGSPSGDGSSEDGGSGQEGPGQGGDGSGDAAEGDAGSSSEQDAPDGGSGEDGSDGQEAEAEEPEVEEPKAEEPKADEPKADEPKAEVPEAEEPEGGKPEASADPAWDRLAQCESTGNWSINTGNGFYGGLQFDEGTWSDFGGKKYAPRADLATKEQQIEIATKVRDARGGYSSWPACSSKLGLPK